MVVASLKSLLHKGQVMHATIVSLLTLTTWFAISQRSSLSIYLSLSLTPTCSHTACQHHKRAHRIYVHFSKFSCIKHNLEARITKQIPWQTKKLMHRDRELQTQRVETAIRLLIGGEKQSWWVRPWEYEMGRWDLWGFNVGFVGFGERERVWVIDLNRWEGEAFLRRIKHEPRVAFLVLFSFVFNLTLLFLFFLVWVCKCREWFSWDMLQWG